jgi:maltose alpha-D-glucosyltransferase/alpha-amylase
VELDLRPWEEAQPIELMGGAHFPPIGELPYLLTLAGHGFYWLRIPRVHQPTGEPAAHPAAEPRVDATVEPSAAEEYQ